MLDTSEIATYRRLFDEKYAEVEQLLADLPPAAMTWKPFETSPWQGAAGSLGWLVAHAVSSTVYLLKRAEWTMGRIDWGDVQGDQGKEEFTAANQDPANMLARAAATRVYVQQLLVSLTTMDLEASRPHARRPELVFTARYDIQHAVEHMSQHIGHAQLTRQLWALQAAAENPQ